MFEGIPVYLEWTLGTKLFQLITLCLEPFWSYKNYDLNWCEDRGVYFVEENGTPTLPYVLANKYDEKRQPYSYYFWTAPHFPLLLDTRTTMVLCQYISLQEAFPFFFSTKEERERFCQDHPALFRKKKQMYLGPWMQQFLNDWATSGFALEGKVVDCPICHASYDYNAVDPCPHLSWCDICQCWSIPPVSGKEDCEHRTRDGLYYLPPFS